MQKFNVQIDDGDGSIEWIQVDAVGEDDAADKAKQILLSMNKHIDDDLVVVITIEKI